VLRRWSRSSSPPRRSLRRSRRARLVGLLAALTVLAPLTGCQDDAAPGRDRTVVAVLLADDEPPRWTERDLPALERRLAGACPECTVVTHVADGDPALQARQLEESLAEGADAVVLQATTAEAGEELVVAADQVPVVAYDRFVPGAAHLVGGNGAAVGRQQARAVLRALGGADGGARGAGVLLVDGVGGNAAEAARRSAVRRALRDAGVRVLDTLDPASAGAEEARRWTSGVLVQRGPAAVDAVIAASDLQAGAVLRAFRAAGVGPAALPVVVGQGADLEAVRRLVTGRQLLTVWTDAREMAGRTAQVAAALARGKDVPEGAGTTRQVEGVPTDVVAPVAVGRDDVAQVLVRQGAVSIEELCDAATRPACQRAGLV
jgi:D-xylose transport system substrate-binding protein